MMYVSPQIADIADENAREVVTCSLLHNFRAIMLFWDPLTRYRAFRAVQFNSIQFS